MRTTLTLDDDVAVRVEHLRRERQASMKEIVNEAIRLGLRAMDEPPRKRKPFRTRTFHCGKPLIPNIDNTAEVLALIEGDNYK
jgi:Ribbon-helix-helix protein, copG family